ncbi:hypothetical protein V501_10061 [Pseudogymnoascus sp. VKM F-4519 (FW-2642)]|nr:hypothetical protein V501_10061 [Pseudogymnoascus sp. VKM F-4519 (FW-2642)]
MSDQDNALALHNQARAALGVAPLQWDNNLQAAAQSWANHLAQVNSLDHDPNASAGENIALFSPASDTILENATGLWLAEKTAYSYGIFDGSQVEAAGHYTQCVWANTTNVGIAAATSSSGTEFVVARYLPQGQRPQQGFEGIFLVNATNSSGGQKCGVGWYRNALQAEGQSPDPPLEAAGVGRDWIPWEGNEQSVTFADGNVFAWNINANAQSEPDYTMVGTSHNNFRNFDVYKDNKRILYSQNGWDYRTIYYCK